MASAQTECDVLVMGTGAAGLTAAVTAAKSGLKVLVVEKEALYGGTTATSGGVLWVPANKHSKEGPRDVVQDKVRRYLQAEAGNYLDTQKVEAFLKHGPEMVDYLERETEVRFYGMDYPDYHTNHPDSSTVRSLGTVDYEAQKLGSELKRLKNQLPQTLFMGLAVGSGVEMKQFMRAGRSVLAMGFVVKKMLKHAGDVVRYGESQQMVRGRALIARLLRTAIDMNIPIWLSSPAKDLIIENGRVTGAHVETKTGPVRVIAHKAVVLACGGFPRDEARRRAVYPKHMAKQPHISPVPMGNTGDGTRMAESAGGYLVTDVAHVSAWQPVSALPGAKDFTHVWPHLADRQKPGVIAVTRHGKRFGDESASYHDLVPALIRACEGEDEASGFIVCDHRAIKRWGLGFVRPFPVPFGHHVRSGYLMRGNTLAELAAKAGINAAQLEETVRQFNEYARKGVDPDFGRGSTVYDQYQGDDENKPNPCLAPLETGPYYAVKLWPGEIGTFAGIRTDPFARVTGKDGAPVPGLYAVGNDQVSVFGGAYPGAGSTLGPAMTFAYVAGKHIAGQLTN